MISWVRSDRWGAAKAADGTAAASKTAAAARRKNGRCLLGKKEPRFLFVPAELAGRT
jgi:hypothetical protein